MPLFDYDGYDRKLNQLKEKYQAAAVFPHIVLDQFVDPDTLEKGLAVFPEISDDGWIHYVHFNESKGGLNKHELIPEPLREIINELNSPRFVKWLSELTGIPKLMPDPSLEGGGLHQIKPGGFLNVHADFTAHPHQRMWRRRVNVLVYLNQDWKEEYGGHLELWTKDMKQCFEKVLPVFNRCVIFNTDRDSYHGHPNPLNCPPDRTRKSIALYYFTEEDAPPLKVATNYQARPGDGIYALFIYMDKKALSLYNRIKGMLGINDDAISAFLKKISRK